MEALRDELEVRKHASENLKKSEATVEKMRKRLEESSDLKDRIEASCSATSTKLKKRTSRLTVGRFIRHSRWRCKTRN